MGELWRLMIALSGLYLAEMASRRIEKICERTDTTIDARKQCHKTVYFLYAYKSPSWTVYITT